MINVLITSASRKVSLVRAFKRALSFEGGGSVVAVDSNPYSAGLYVADRAYLVPKDGHHRFWDVLRSIILKEQVNLVVPTRDEELLTFAEARGWFKELGATVLVPAPETVRLCQDKSAFIQFCLRHGFAVPSLLDSERLSPHDFPVFVRGRVGKGSRLARRVDTPEELTFLRRTWHDLIVQEYVNAPEYTVDLVANLDGSILSVVPRRRVLTVAGESFAGQVVKHRGLIDAVSCLGSKLGLVGHNTIQCFLEAREVKFIEVNPRYGGGASIGFLAGADSPRILIRVAKGERVTPDLTSFVDGTVVLRYVEDLVVNSLVPWVAEE